MQTCKVGQTKKLSDFVNSYLLYTYQEDSGKYLPTYLKMSQDVYSDLQFHILSSEIKKIYTIDPKLNTVTLPDDCLYWLQIEALKQCTRNGKLHEELVPLLENNNKDFPYIEEVKAIPGCVNPKCNSDICSGVKSITAVEEVVNIGGTDYTNVTKTQLLGDGSMIREICKWYTTGEEVSNYTIGGNHADNTNVSSIKINDIDYNIDTTYGDLSLLLSALNSLGLGIFTFDDDIGLISNNNPNNVQSIDITGFFGDETINAVETNTHIEAHEVCSTDQLCKLDLNEDKCVEETPANIVKIKECCTCLDVCCDRKHDLELPTINVHDGIIYFSNNNYPKVLLTYKTSGINFASETMIPTIAEQAMIAGLNFNSMKFKKNVGIREREEARAYYNIEKNKLIKVLFPFREQELIKVARGVRPIW